MICLRKDLYHVGTNAQVSGMRSWHADTPTRLFSESTHETQTFLDKLRKPKNHQRPLTQTKTQFNLKDISFSTKIRIKIEKQTRTF